MVVFAAAGTRKANRQRTTRLFQFAFDFFRLQKYNRFAVDLDNVVALVDGAATLNEMHGSTPTSRGRRVPSSFVSKFLRSE